MSGCSRPARMLRKDLNKEMQFEKSDRVAGDSLFAEALTQFQQSAGRAVVSLLAERGSTVR